jgi:alpha-D-ribose 1-methylphosphonate 5-triphosphate synthase subunit PhnH
MNASALARGFADPVQQAQRTFRCVLSAMSAPATVVTCDAAPQAPAPMGGASAALALTLLDFETRVWLDDAYRSAAGLVAWLAFHTGARLVEAPDEADFAFVSSPLALPPLGVFSQGSLEYPDRSATLIVQCEAFCDALTFTGPGLARPVRFGPTPLPADFVAALHANHARFPRGVDLIFATSADIGALPRSVRIVGP